MKLCMIGTGYVGLVSGVCFADLGNDVICVDNNLDKINLLKKGKIPIYEPGLDTLVLENLQKGTLRFSTIIHEVLSFADIVFIAVGTPMGEDGSADLQYVIDVANSIGENLQHHTIIVNKSTVPVGTADKVRATIQQVLDARSSKLTFDVVSNPEFLKEGAAIKDFMHPDRVVVGAENDDTLKLIRSLYSCLLYTSPSPRD